MGVYSERRRRKLYGTRIAILAGILVALIGVWFLFGISGSTDSGIAECTEETAGKVVSSEPSGSRFSTTVEYTPGYSPMTVTLRTKKQYEPGTEIAVKYNPTSFTKIYIEGMSETGSADRTQGILFIALGAVLAAAGMFLKKLRKKNS